MRFCKIKNHKHMHKEFFEKSYYSVDLKMSGLIKKTLLIFNTPTPPTPYINDFANTDKTLSNCHNIIKME